MSDNRKLVFFHSPNTRSAGARVLLEELGVPYENVKVDFLKGTKTPEFRKIKPTAGR